MTALPEKTNITNVKPDIGLEPLRVGMDFNIGNMNAVIGIVQNTKIVNI